MTGKNKWIICAKKIASKTNTSFKKWWENKWFVCRKSHESNYPYKWIVAMRLSDERITCESKWIMWKNHVWKYVRPYESCKVNELCERMTYENINQVWKWINYVNHVWKWLMWKNHLWEQMNHGNHMWKQINHMKRSSAKTNESCERLP